MSAEFVTLAKTTDIPIGRMAGFDIGNTRVAVANVDGTFYAFGDTCTHEECPLSDGELDHATVICPCHLGQFDVRTGEVLAPPPLVAVSTYRVRVEDGFVQVAL
jgi:nitrite reductase/ring-hydroxylating ferredoxin subunit